MSGRILVQIDETSYASVRKTLSTMRTEFPRRAISSIQRSMTKVKALVVDNTYEVVNLTKTRITQELFVEVSGDVSIPKLDDFRIMLRSSGVPVGLINFATNKSGWTWYNPKPIRVKIYRTGTTYVFDHAFLAPGRGGKGEHMWERVTRLGFPWNPLRHYNRLEYDLRFPIERMSTIRIQDVQGDARFIGVILLQGANMVVADLKTEIDVLTGE